MKYYLLTIFLAAALFGCKNDSQDAADSAQAETVTPAQPTAPAAGEAIANPSNYKFPDIEGKVWKLSKYEYDGKSNAPFEQSVLTLEIVEDKVSGNAGCNDYNGKVVLKDKGSVSFSAIASTKMRCDRRMTQEVRFLQLLESANAYEVNMVVLRLKGPKGSLTFRNDGH